MEEELTSDEFHHFLHEDIDRPVKDFRQKDDLSRKKVLKTRSKAHKMSWANAQVSFKRKSINLSVNLNFKQNSLSDPDYQKLKDLSRSGISEYWSRHIKVGGITFVVRVSANHSYENAIPVDLYIETDQKNYARSMNPAVLGIDASFIYNRGHSRTIERADLDFKLVAAHEFGHSVLMYVGGLILSWGHKGSTNAMTQSIKSSTPGYPKKGTIDLMKYYDGEKNMATFRTRVRDTRAMNIDVKRLIWGAKMEWLK